MQTNDLALRLSEIVEKHYGCRVQFLTPSEIPKHADVSELLGRHPNVPRFITGAGLYIPVRADGELFGVVAITELRGLDGDALERICDLTEAVLVSLFQDVEKTQKSFFEKTAQAKIISLSERRTKVRRSMTVPPMFEQESEDEEDAEIIPMPGNRTKYPDPLLLVGPSNADMHKIAFDIHNDSGSTCFLPWEALTIKTSDELFALGGMTIFIRDIARLLDHEQTVLAAFLATKTEDERPKIIAGAEAPAMDLAAEGKIATGLAFVFHEMEIETPATVADSDDSPIIH